MNRFQLYYLIMKNNYGRYHNRTGFDPLEWLADSLHRDSDNLKLYIMGADPGEEELLYTKKHLFTACFFLLCFVDQMLSIANEYIRTLSTASTGLIIGFIVLVGMYRKRHTFLVNIPSIIWAVIYLPIMSLLIKSTFGADAFSKENWTPTPDALMVSQDFQIWIINALCVGLFIFILLKLIPTALFEFTSGDAEIQDAIHYVFLTPWFLMMLFLIIFRHEASWPITFLIIFVAFYFGEFTKNEITTLIDSMCNGIIIAFFVFQGFATMYRSLDVLGYAGMFATDKANALFYVLVQAAFLAKLYRYHRVGALLRYKLLVFAGAGIMISYCALTTISVAFYTMLFNTILTAILIAIVKKNVRIPFRIAGALLRVIFIVLIGYFAFSPVYFTVRNIQSNFYVHMVMFNENRDNKITWAMPNDPHYIPKDRVIEEATGRFFGFEDPFMKQAMKDQKEMRKETKKAFRHEINLIGHGEEEAGLWVTDEYFAPNAGHIFTHIFYTYGIIGGIFFLVDIVILIGFFIYKSFKPSKADWTAGAGLIFLSCFLVFGSYEMTWKAGQLTFVLYFILHTLLIDHPKQAEQATIAPQSNTSSARGNRSGSQRAAYESSYDYYDTEHINSKQSYRSEYAKTSVQDYDDIYANSGDDYENISTDDYDNSVSEGDLSQTPDNYPSESVGNINSDNRFNNESYNYADNYSNTYQNYNTASLSGLYPNNNTIATGNTYSSTDNASISYDTIAQNYAALMGISPAEATKEPQIDGLSASDYNAIFYETSGTKPLPKITLPEENNSMSMYSSGDITEDYQDELESEFGLDDEYEDIYYDDLDS